MSTRITIDVDDYLTDDDIIELVEDRGLESRIRYSPPTDPGFDMSPRAHWDDLANDLRAAARADDRTHFDVLLLRMFEMAGLHHAPPTSGLHKRAPN